MVPKEEEVADFFEALIGSHNVFSFSFFVFNNVPLSTKERVQKAKRLEEKWSHIPLISMEMLVSMDMRGKRIK